MPRSVWEGKKRGWSLFCAPPSEPSRRPPSATLCRMFAAHIFTMVILPSVSVPVLSEQITWGALFVIHCNAFEPVRVLLSAFYGVLGCCICMYKLLVYFLVQQVFVTMVLREGSCLVRADHLEQRAYGTRPTLEDRGRKFGRDSSNVGRFSFKIESKSGPSILRSEAIETEPCSPSCTVSCYPNAATAQKIRRFERAAHRSGAQRLHSGKAPHQDVVLHHGHLPSSCWIPADTIAQGPLLSPGRQTSAE